MGMCDDKVSISKKSETVKLLSENSHSAKASYQVSSNISGTLSRWGKGNRLVQLCQEDVDVTAGSLHGAAHTRGKLLRGHPTTPLQTALLKQGSGTATNGQRDEVT
jgi:hypothetical protein